MKFLWSRVINRLTVPITRACNRACPECTNRERDGIYGNGERNPHMSYDEIVWVGKNIGKIGRVEITGGEPTVHPDFQKITVSLRDIFQSDDIMLVTNGYIFEDDDKLPLLLKYNRIYLTDYTQKFADKYGTPSNTEVCDKICDYLEGHKEVRVWRQRMDEHLELKDDVPNATTCRNGHDRGDMIGYHRGQLYGCCIAWGLDYPGKGIVLAKDWRDRLCEMELPCNKCFLGVAQ